MSNLLFGPTMKIREPVSIRPRVMYTVPVGQNPSGLVCLFFFNSRSLSDCCRCCQTMGLERKGAIYDVCVEYGAVSSPSGLLLDLIF